MEPQEIHELIVETLDYALAGTDDWSEPEWAAIQQIRDELNQIMGEHHDGPSQVRDAYQRVLRCCQHRIRMELGK